MSDLEHLKGRHIAAGRVLAGWSQADLATAARISVATLRRMEASPGQPSGMANNIMAVRTALEKAGVEFIEGGVRERPGIHLSRLSVPQLAQLVEEEETGRAPDDGDPRGKFTLDE